MLLLVSNQVKQPLSQIHSLLRFTVLVTIFDTLCNLQGQHCRVLSGKSDDMMATSPVYCRSCPWLTFPKMQTRPRSCWFYLFAAALRRIDFFNNSNKVCMLEYFMLNTWIVKTFWLKHCEMKFTKMSELSNFRIY